MERDPLLNQSGGRPPNNCRSTLSNGRQDRKNAMNTSSTQLSGQAPRKPKEKNAAVDNSQLASQFFDAVFANDLEKNPKNYGCLQESKNKGVTILGNTNFQIEENAESLMDQESFSISSMDEKFETVKNKKRKVQGDINMNLSKTHFKNVNKVDNKVDNVNRVNKFSLLGDLNVEAGLVDRQNTERTRPILNDYSQTNTIKKNRYCPPIFLENVNVKSLIDQLNSKNVEFKIKNQSLYKSKLYFQDASAHSEMMQLLKDQNIPSYTYTPREHKRQSVVCRGLYYRTDIDDIKTEINRIAPDMVDSISKFSTEYSKKHNIDTGLFLIVLKNNRNVNELLGVKCILNQIVSWERPKTNLKIPQCWRCQRWGHYSKNCSRPYSCMKCNEKHDPGECTFVPEDNILPFCVNCNENGHTSNYKGCPAYKKYASYRKKSFQEKKERKISAAANVTMALNASNPVTPNKTFASLFNPVNEFPTRNRTEKPAFIQEFMKIAKLFCAPEPLTLEDKINNFMRNYTSMPKDQAKGECLSLIKDIQDVYGP